MITDGLSNTVLFAEGYQLCNKVGRYALYSAGHENFGITPSLGLAPTQISSPTGEYPMGSFTAQYGLPNTLMFQTQPPLVCNAQVTNCCDEWRSQTAHTANPVAMVDGSVRSVFRTVDQTTWSRLLLPRDGQILDGGAY